MTRMDMPLRKTTHLTQYDYATPGAYFVTICTKDRKELLCHIVGEGFHPLPQKTAGASPRPTGRRLVRANKIFLNNIHSYY